MIPKPTRVNDAGIIRLLSGLMDDALDEVSAAIRFDWLKQRGWMAFPVPGDCCLPGKGDSEVPNLMAGMMALGSERLLAANLERPEGEPDFAWEAGVTPEKLVALSDELQWRPFLVTDPAVSFLIYCTKAGYHVVGGPPAFFFEGF